MVEHRVRKELAWRQPALPGLLEQVGPLAAPPGGSGVAGGAADARTAWPAQEAAEAARTVRDAGADWEAAAFAAGCRYARALAGEALAALEARLHAARPGGYAVEGWRERWLVTRMGELRVRRRLYRAPDGRAHFLLDEHLGWPPRRAATPDVAALLVAWATRVPYRVAVRQLGQATVGVLGASARLTASQNGTDGGGAWASARAKPWQ